MGLTPLRPASPRVSNYIIVGDKKYTFGFAGNISVHSASRGKWVIDLRGSIPIPPEIKAMAQHYSRQNKHRIPIPVYPYDIHKAISSTPATAPSRWLNEQLKPFLSDADADPKTNLENWINEKLNGAELLDKNKGAKVTRANTIRSNAVNIEKKLNEILESTEDATPEEREKAKKMLTAPPASKAETDSLVSDLCGAIAHSLVPDLSSPVELINSVKGVVEGVVTSIPLLGTIVAGTKSIFKGIQLGMLIKEMMDVSDQRKTSLALIEIRALGAVENFEERKAAVLTKDIAANAAVAGAAAFGGGIFAKVGQSFLNIVFEITAIVADLLDVRNTNKFLKSGTISLTNEGDFQTLMLILPQLREMNFLVLQAGLPIGWNKPGGGDLKGRTEEILSAQPDLLKELAWDGNLAWDQTKANYAEPGKATGLVNRLRGILPGSSSKLRSPWDFDYENLKRLLETTNNYHKSQIWRLYKPGTGTGGAVGGGETPAPPTSLVLAYNPDKPRFEIAGGTTEKAKKMLVDVKNIPRVIRMK